MRVAQRKKRRLDPHVPTPVRGAMPMFTAQRLCPHGIFVPPRRREVEFGALAPKANSGFMLLASARSGNMVVCITFLWVLVEMYRFRLDYNGEVTVPPSFASSHAHPSSIAVASKNYQGRDFAIRLRSRQDSRRTGRQDLSGGPPCHDRGAPRVGRSAFEGPGRCQAEKPPTSSVVSRRGFHHFSGRPLSAAG